MKYLEYINEGLYDKEAEDWMKDNINFDKVIQMDVKKLKITFPDQDLGHIEVEDLRIPLLIEMPSKLILDGNHRWMFNAEDPPINKTLPCITCPEIPLHLNSLVIKAAAKKIYDKYKNTRYTGNQPSGEYD